MTFGIIEQKFPSRKKKELKLDFKTTKNVKFCTEYGLDEDFLSYKDKVKDNKLFDIYSHLANPYTLVNYNYVTFEKINKKFGVKLHDLTKYEKLTRAYYKLWEILHEYKVIPNKKKVVFGGLAEGPGGFIQALVDYRHYIHKSGKDDKIYAISLKNPKQESVAFSFGQKKIVNFINKYTKMGILHINYGDKKINDGNLNKVENVKSYAKLFDDHNADVVTGDGGIPYIILTGENVSSETLTAHLFFSETVAALAISAVGASYVCKLFSTFTRPTTHIIYLCTVFYDEVYLVNPVTSKIFSAERYIVCKGFRGISKSQLSKLYKAMGKWQELDPSGGLELNDEFVDKIFDIRLDSEFKEGLSGYFNQFKKINYDILGKTEKYMKKEDSGKKISKKDVEKILEKQQKLAIKWFEKYKIEIDERKIVKF